jgi:Putative restriction endonuclease
MATVTVESSSPTIEAASTEPTPSLATASTPALPTTVPAPAPVSTLNLYRISYDLYERIVELGLLGPNDKVVLLGGLLLNLMSKGHLHRSAVLRGLKALGAAIPDGWHIQPEQAVVLRGGPDGDSAPEPDLAVIFGDLARYDQRLPIGAEVGLIIEVATSPDAVRIDRAGLHRYAHAGIPIACIVNIPDRSIEVYSEPSGPSADPVYRRFETLRPGQFLAGEIGNATTDPAALTPIPVEAFFAPN